MVVLDFFTKNDISKNHFFLLYKKYFTVYNFSFQIRAMLIFVKKKFDLPMPLNIKKLHSLFTTFFILARL